MTFKDELLGLKQDLKTNNNYNRKYISEQLTDLYDLERELRKRNWAETQSWSLYNTRQTIENQKSASKKKAFTEIRNGIKSYIAMLLEKDIDFDSIDLVLGINLFLEESAFKAQKPASERTTSDYLADTITISNIQFATEGATGLITLGKSDIAVSFEETKALLGGLGFTVPDKTFEELVEERKQSQFQNLRFTIPLTNEKENDTGIEIEPEETTNTEEKKSASVK